MTDRPPRLRRMLVALAAAGLLAACGEDAPDLPEAPPAQDGTTTEAPAPEEGLDVDEDAVGDG